MPNSTELSEFNVWKKKYKDNHDRYQSIWSADIGCHPLDYLFFDLASIYYRASHSDRQIIESFFAQKQNRFLFSRSRNPTRLLQLVYFIRRISKLINSSEQVDIVRTGLAIASIEGGRYDFRDTIVSLLVLRFAAEKNNINFLQLLDTIIPIVRLESRVIFLNVKNHSESDILFTVRRHGPPSWF